MLGAWEPSGERCVLPDVESPTALARDEADRCPRHRWHGHEEPHTGFPGPPAERASRSLGNIEVRPAAVTGDRPAAANGLRAPLTADFRRQSRASLVRHESGSPRVVHYLRVVVTAHPTAPPAADGAV